MNLVRHRVQLVAAARGDADVDAGLGQRQRDGLADAPARAGHDGLLALDGELGEGRHGCMVPFTQMISLTTRLR